MKPKGKLKKSKALPAPIESEPRNTTNGAEFLCDACWKEVFNPTIMHALYISREPFLDFTGTSDSPSFLATVQTAFDLSFPNVNFTLTLDDPIVTMVGYHVHYLVNNNNFLIATGL